MKRVLARQISLFVTTVNRDMLGRVKKEFLHLLGVVRAADGGHIEYSYKMK